MIKIVHDLLLRFETVYVDWIPREANAFADILARYGSNPRLTSEAADVFRIFFQAEEILKESKL